jgi:hypothetical protein
LLGLRRSGAGAELLSFSMEIRGCLHGQYS